MVFDITPTKLSPLSIQSYEEFFTNLIEAKLIAFPEFELSLTSILKPWRRTAPDFCACAYTGMAALDREKRRRKSLPTWLIEFNDMSDWSGDMDMVLYHELAHFIAHSIAHDEPPHGLLWSLCCDALQLAMEMDDENLREGTLHLHTIPSNERIATLAHHDLADTQAWEGKRDYHQFQLADRISKYDGRIHFEDLVADIIAVWSGQVHSDLNKSKAISLPTLPFLTPTSPDLNMGMPVCRSSTIQLKKGRVI